MILQSSRFPWLTLIAYLALAIGALMLFSTIVYGESGVPLHGVFGSVE